MIFTKHIKKGLQKTKNLKTLQKLIHAGKANDVLLVGIHLYHIVEVGYKHNTRASVDANAMFTTDEKGNIENYNDFDSIGHGWEIYYTNEQALQSIKKSFNI